MAQAVARPPVPDVEAVPAELVALTVVLAGVLIGARRMVPRVPIRRESHHGRAPPGFIR
jgi:hypothetical protein